MLLLRWVGCWWRAARRFLDKAPRSFSAGGACCSTSSRCDDDDDMTTTAGGKRSRSGVACFLLSRCMCVEVEEAGFSGASFGVSCVR